MLAIQKSPAEEELDEIHQQYFPCVEDLDLTYWKRCVFGKVIG